MEQVKNTKVLVRQRRPKPNNNKNRKRIRVKQQQSNDLLTTTEYIEPNRINQFRTKTGAKLLRELQIYHRYVKNRYLVGLVHPDLAVKEQIPVKLYSDVPIPTASIGHHEQYQFTTNASGAFLLSWRPCFLMTATDLSSVNALSYSHLTFNNSAGLTGQGTQAGNFFVAGSFAPAISIQRYRLVSALLKISYNGSVLNQAGTMISCATFDPLVVATGNANNAVSIYADSLIDRFGNFSIITNGLWNTSTDITNNSQGIECLYVPTDPDDYTFVRAGRYYDNAVSGAGTIVASEVGAHIAYVVAGRNFPVSSTCVIVDIYYNYEVIADPTAAPFLRSAPDSVFDSKDRDNIHDAISGVVKQGSLIKPMSNGASFKEILKDVAMMGMSYIPKLLGSLL